MENNSCVSFYDDNSLTAKTNVKERIYEESYTPPPADNTTPTPVKPTTTVKQKSTLWIWAAVAFGAILIAPTKKEEPVE